MDIIVLSICLSKTNSIEWCTFYVYYLMIVAHFVVVEGLC